MRELIERIEELSDDKIVKKMNSLAKKYGIKMKIEKSKSKDAIADQSYVFGFMDDKKRSELSEKLYALSNGKLWIISTKKDGLVAYF